jgi:hypothetical protein
MHTAGITEAAVGGFIILYKIMNIPNVADGSDIGDYEVLQNKFESS